MEIDHFDPRLRHKFIQQYSNLFLATRHCNGAKSDIWPTRAEQALGLRFLNPCEEQDYGVHIFEDPKTHQLVGVTAAGRFHIRCCDLNADHLVGERRDRASIRELLEKTPISLKKHFYSPELAELTAELREVLETMIPVIPPPPDHLGPPRA